jgi:transposase-like protein
MLEMKLDLAGVAGPRRRRSAQERLQIGEESSVHEMSVARVASKYGTNANRVFQWRHFQQDGQLVPNLTG